MLNGILFFDPSPCSTDSSIKYSALLTLILISINEDEPSAIDIDLLKRVSISEFSVMYAEIYPICLHCSRDQRLNLYVHVNGCSRPSMQM